MKEFSPLHCTISLLVRNCDISILESEGDGPQQELPANPYMIGNKADLQPLSDGMHLALFNVDHSKRFTSEVMVTMVTFWVSCQVLYFVLCSVFFL